MRRALIFLVLVPALAHATAEREYKNGEYVVVDHGLAPNHRWAVAATTGDDKPTPTPPPELAPLVTRSGERYALRAKGVFKLDASDRYTVGPLSKVN